MRDAFVNLFDSGEPTSHAGHVREEVYYTSPDDRSKLIAAIHDLFDNSADMAEDSAVMQARTKILIAALPRNHASVAARAAEGRGRRHLRIYNGVV